MISPIRPGTRVNLRTLDPEQAGLFPDGKDAAAKELAKLQEKLADLQERFYVARQQKLLVVFQGMDTSGKSGTIRTVFRAANPQGVTVASFKRPTTDELAHDFLWRIHARAPARGEIVIFDRSHYEDITAVRVHNILPPPVWKKRFDHIRDFERMLTDEGTIILKFFLHIDRDEQKARLESRLSEPRKRWKFEPADLVARKFWDQYMDAHSDAINDTSTKHSPWYVVPANKKWLRNLVVARVIVDRLKKLELTYPKIEFKPGEIVIE